ncbi:unnamed protein product [Lampetra fluviatilis]
MKSQASKEGQEPGRPLDLDTWRARWQPFTTGAHADQAEEALARAPEPSEGRGEFASLGVCDGESRGRARVHAQGASSGTSRVRAASSALTLN